MDLPLESSSSRKAQSNKLAVFLSIENRSELIEGRKSMINDEMTNQKNQNIRTMENNSTKRYSIPHNVNDTFYAIHHIQRSIKENERIQSENNNNSTSTSENIEPEEQAKTSSKKPLMVRGRKRTTEHKPADTPTSPSDSNYNTKRKKSRQQNKARKSANDSTMPSLYQTCIGLWPEQQSLGDFSHDNIKELSNLLKVRLCQAKFKMMAKLDQDNELFTFLAEEYVPPKPRLPLKLKVHGKQSKSSLSIVGNGKNLFKRNNVNNDDILTSSPPMIRDLELKQPLTPKEVVSSPQRISKPQKERKKRTPRNPSSTNSGKAKKNTTPKRKSAAGVITPIVQSDGSSVYVCEPCNKKYKNRNGLAYHLVRCKHRQDDEEGKEQSSQAEDSIINCICTQNTDEHGTMVQCDKCRVWLHSECVGLTEENLDDLFYCNTCKEESNDQQEDNNNNNSSQQNDLLQRLIEAQQASDYELSSQDNTNANNKNNNNIQDLFSQTTKNDDNQTDDDELYSMPIEEDDNSSEADDTVQNNEIPDSTQLHVWDDFDFASLEKSNNEPWSMLDDEEPFSNYDNDIPSSTWTMNDLNIFSQPPSLLFSDATLSSALDEDLNSVPLIGDLAADPSIPMTEATPLNESSTPLNEQTPMNEIATPACSSNDVSTPNVVSNTNTPVHTADGLWFQFANFDDDYQCDTQ